MKNSQPQFDTVIPSLSITEQIIQNRNKNPFQVAGEISHLWSNGTCTYWTGPEFMGAGKRRESVLLVAP